MQTAVLVDAAFFIRRYRTLLDKNREHSGEKVADELHHWARRHLADDGSGDPESCKTTAELYRVFVYDCPPFDGVLTHPISKKQIDFKNTSLYKFRTDFHQHLKQLRKVALRLGHLGETRQWIIKPSVQTELLKGKRTFDSLQVEDITLETKQKGVDMRIGVDVASLSFKRQVQRIVLIAGDADFVPAAKLARREGIDFILDPMNATISPNLYEHIDGLRTRTPVEIVHRDEKHPPKGYGMSYSYTQNAPASQPAVQPNSTPTFWEVLDKLAVHSLKKSQGG